MDEIDVLIQAGGSETVEFKETWRDSDALRELAAFANARGGTLLVGVADGGNVVGRQGDDGDLGALTNKIADGLRVHPTVMRVEPVHDASSAPSAAGPFLNVSTLSIPIGITPDAIRTTSIGSCARTTSAMSSASKG